MPTEVWPAQMVKRPRSGRPSMRSHITKNSSSDTPVITSGTTSGALMRAMKAVRPRNFLYLTMANAASMPRSTELVADSSAIFSESLSPSMTSVSLATRSYHLSVKPPHSATIFESLKEKTIRVKMGRYKNRAPSESHIFPMRLPMSGSPAGFGLVLIENHQREQDQQRHADGHRRGHGPVVVAEKFVPEHAPYHQRAGAAQQFGNHILPHTGNEYQHGAGNDSVLGQRHGDQPECLEWRGAQILGRFQQAQIHLPQIGVQRKNHERQIGIDHAQHHGETGVHHFDGLIDQVDR